MKNYIKPTIKAKNIIIEKPLLATSEPTIDPDLNANSRTTPLTNGHRGSWGNLWNEDEE